MPIWRPCAAAEIETFFEPQLKALSARSNGNAMELLTDYYNGYRFYSANVDNAKAMRVFNPWSVLGALSSLQLSDYWMQSGNTHAVVRALSLLTPDLTTLLEGRCLVDLLTTTRFSTTAPLPMLYQTGYLTIKSVDGGWFATVAPPNKEVSRAVFFLLS